MRILLVDDASITTDYLRDAVRLAGHEVVGIGRDGQEGIDLYFRLKPDLVTMDLDMPGMKGMDALREIRRRDPSARVLVMTALSRHLVSKEVLELGARGVLSKPARMGQLIAAINEALSND